MKWITAGLRLRNLELWMQNKDKGATGSSLDNLLKEEGIYDGANNTAIKRTLNYQLQQAMEEMKLTKSAIAEQMEISCSALDQLLDPENDSDTLETLEKAARMTGQRLEIRLVSGG